MEYPSAHVYSPPANDSIDLLYEDGDLIVVDKPAGLLSVPGRGEEKQDSLIQRLQMQYPDALIVHRLDMDTSGVMVLARNKTMHRELSIRFQQRQVEKEYMAVVAGRIEVEQGVIDLPLMTDWPRRPLQKVDLEQGKPSVTRYRVVEYCAQTNTTRVALCPVTGRSHQLRVHLQQLGHPILGDRLYAPEAIRQLAPRLLLHACELDFVHPASGQQQRFVSTPPF